MTSVLPAARPPPPEFDDDDEMDQVMATVDEVAIERMDSTDPMTMLSFYRHLLPWKSLFTWLNREAPHAVTRAFTHREFAFTLQNEAYLRYNSFSTWEELKREVIRLNPARFEIGPVYSAKPKDRKTVQKTSFKPVSRELVFDIDMTDYDEVRTCCSGKDICKRCWGFIAVAVEVLDEALRSDFGFKHLLWVYSGRRGIHCWVSDASAVELADDARKAIVGWLEVIKGGANVAKKVDVGANGNTNGRALHPSLRRALGGEGSTSAAKGDAAANPPGPLKRAFVDIILEDQDCFRSQPGYTKLLALLPASEADGIAKLKAKWDGAPGRSSSEKWKDVMDLAGRAGDLRAKTTWKPALEDIILQYTYPRIDAEVSKHMNHLLKSPFVVHPATGRVCVPIDAKKVADFDPATCPTVAQLFRDLNTSKKREGQDAPTGGKEPRQDWERTSLRPYVELLDRHCAGIVKEARDAKRGQALDTMDF